MDALSHMSSIVAHYRINAAGLFAHCLMEKNNVQAITNPFSFRQILGFYILIDEKWRNALADT